MPARGTATNRQPAVNRGLASNRGTASGRLNVSGSGGGGGGSSLIDSSGSTLGAVPAILTTKLLTADNQVYFSDGSNWLPFVTPGWPRRDGANDQEWEGANADPPSGWSWQDQSSWAVDVNNTRKSCIQFLQTTNSGNFTTIYRSATLTTTNKTIYAVFEVNSSASVSNQNGRAGIIVRNSSNGRAVGLYTEFGAGSANLCVIDLTDSTTGTLQLRTAQGVMPMNHPFILAINNDGTNLKMKWSAFYGAAETDLQQVYTETLVSYLTAAGGACDQIGYIMNMNTAGQTIKIISDWIRVI